MPSPDDYIDRINEILKTLGVKGKVDVRKTTKLAFEWNGVSEAKQHLTSIRHAQRQLRQLKREINTEVKAVRTQYRAKSARVQPSAWLSLLGSRGTARSLAADKKRSIRQELDRLVAPYERLKLAIDELLIQLDKGKIQLQGWIDEHK